MWAGEGSRGSATPGAEAGPALLVLSRGRCRQRAARVHSQKRRHGCAGAEWGWPVSLGLGALS